MESEARNACNHDRNDYRRTVGTTEMLLLSLFSRKKEKQKKLAAADKSAKILSFSLDKNKLASLRQYFCLNRSTTEFLDAISPRRQELRLKIKILLKNKSLLTVVR